MVKRKKTVLLVFLSVALFFSILSYFWSETSLFYGQSQVKPIKIYWKVNPFTVKVNENIYLGMHTEPTYSISNLTLKINNVVNSSTIEFQIECENFSRDNIDFFDHYDNTIVGNFSRVKEYENSNPHDILLISDLITNGKLFSWIQVWNNMISFNELMVSCKPFLKQVAFNTWEGEYLFDRSGTTINEGNLTFAIADVQKLSFNVKVPINYKIQNPEDKNLSQTPDGFQVSASITPQGTFHLIIIDLNREGARTILSVFSYVGVPGFILGLIIEYFRRK